MSEPTTEKKIVEVPSDERTNVEIIPFGTDERIKLNIAIVQKMVAVPTRSGKIPDPSQCMKFIMLCKARHLNPFEGDAYLIGYDTQAGPQFSLITAHQVFLKRAEASEGFDGMQSGVVVKAANGILEREGDLTVEGDELIGGWAKVYRRDRTHPFYRRLKLSTFNTGKSRWEKDPAGMIVKCAEADALRSAFPTHLGGLYISEERPPIDVTATTVPIPRPLIAAASVEESDHEKSAKKTRGKKKEAQPTEGPNAIEIEKRLKAAGASVVDLLRVAIKKQWIDAPDADLNTYPLSAIPEDKLEAILDVWPDVAEEIDSLKTKKPAGDLPFA